jgi:hypothetical protein
MALTPLHMFGEANIGPSRQKMLKHYKTYLQHAPSHVHRIAYLKHMLRHADNAAAGSDRHASRKYNSSSQALACCDEQAALQATCALLANNTSCRGKP